MKALNNPVRMMYFYEMKKTILWLEKSEYMYLWKYIKMNILL